MTPSNLWRRVRRAARHQTDRRHLAELDTRLWDDVGREAVRLELRRAFWLL